MKHAITILLCLQLLACATPPRTIGDQLASDNPRVIAYLSKLTPADHGKAIDGVRLSDGSNDLRGHIFLGSRIDRARGWHIYLFEDDGSTGAFAWVDAGGKPLPIPLDGSQGESAAVLSGDIYTFTEVGPDDGVVILYGATPAWLKTL
jgi:hypothetical protein